jgi:hypothetical protein
LISYVLSLMLLLAPRRNQERIRPLAEAIASATASRREAALLVAIEFHENGFNPRARYPFGVTSRRNQTLPEAAALALRIFHNGHATCGGRPQALHYYNIGACPLQAHRNTTRAERYSAAVERTFQRLRR